MLSLIFVVAVIAFFVVGMVLKHHDFVCTILRLSLLSICLVIGAHLVQLTCELSEANTLDQRIDLIQDQNYKIEERLEEAVQAYIDLKHSEGKDVTIDNRMNSIFAIPELQNNTMIQTEVTQFSKNETEILNLEQKKLRIGYYKWLLYFGKEDPKVKNVTILEPRPENEFNTTTLPLAPIETK